jgi:ParB-like chromosome segregation protein Spo0J
MTPLMYSKAIESIKEFGFIDPVTVRQNPAGSPRFQILDGEHRWRVGRDLGLPQIPYFDVGPIDDQRAKKLTIVLNELHGQYDPKSMGDLLNDLLSRESPTELLLTVPFTEEALAGMVGLKDFDWKGLDTPVRKPAQEEAPKWRERTFRMPMDADAVLQQALDKAKGGESMEDWQALELMAADFLAS